MCFAAAAVEFSIHNCGCRRDKELNVIKISGCVPGGEVEAAGLVGVRTVVKKMQMPVLTLNHLSTIKLLIPTPNAIDGAVCALQYRRARPCWNSVC